MWMPPRPAELKETWGEWWEGWKMWGSQVAMNLWYGRGGLNVKVSEKVWFDWSVLFHEDVVKPFYL